MDYEFILFNQDDVVVTITLNRPDAMNALSHQLERELHQALDEADADPAVRVIVLTGAGRAFSAGYDFDDDVLEDDATAGAVLRRWLDINRRSTEGFMHVMELSTPVIAAVNGWCLGGGFWYALCSDITIASEEATFGQPEVRGISSSSILFAVLAGWKNAHRYTLTGDHFDAPEALRIGVVNEVVPHGVAGSYLRSRPKDRYGAGGLGPPQQGDHDLWFGGNGTSERAQRDGVPRNHCACIR